MKIRLVFRFGGESLLTSDKKSRELNRNTAFFRHVVSKGNGTDRIIACHNHGHMVVYPGMKSLGFITSLSIILLLSSCTLEQHAAVNVSNLTTRRPEASAVQEAIFNEHRAMLEEEIKTKALKDAIAAENAAKNTDGYEAAKQARIEAEQEVAAAHKAAQEASQKVSQAEQEQRLARRKARLNKKQQEARTSESPEAKLPAEVTAQPEPPRPADKTQKKKATELKTRQDRISKAQALAERDVSAGSDENLQTKPKKTPRLITSRRAQDDNEPIIVPTKEQQAAAHKTLVRQQAHSQKSAIKTKKQQQSPLSTRKQQRPAMPEMEEEPAAQPAAAAVFNRDIRTSLRQQKFSPKHQTEEEDVLEHLPNAVELRGLRSPEIHGGLPMNIDGKIINKD